MEYEWSGLAAETKVIRDGQIFDDADILENLGRL